MEDHKTYSVGDARAHLTDVLGYAAYRKERVMITRRDKPIAFVVPIEDVECLELLEDAYDIKMGTEALKEAQEKGFITLEDLKKKLGF